MTDPVGSSEIAEEKRKLKQVLAELREGMVNVTHNALEKHEARQRKLEEISAKERKKIEEAKAAEAEEGTTEIVEAEEWLRQLIDRRTAMIGIDKYETYIYKFPPMDADKMTGLVALSEFKAGGSNSRPNTKSLGDDTIPPAAYGLWFRVYDVVRSEMVQSFFELSSITSVERQKDA